METRIRGTDVYDWWSRHPQALELLYAGAFLGREAEFRERTMDALAPAAGELVLEVGCGNGNGLTALRDGVGPGGRVVGVDASQGMVRAARERIAAAGWDDVHAVRGDARALPVADGTVDAAVAAMSLSAVPSPEAAIDAVWRALRPGGRFVVLDARPFDRWPWRAVNPVVVPLAKRATDWVTEADPVTALRNEFASVEATAFNGGSIIVAHAKKVPESG